MSNPCGFTAASYQDLADILCTIQTQLNTRFTTVDGNLTIIDNDVANVNSHVLQTKSDVDGLRDWVGDPMGGPTVNAQLATIDGVVDSISTDTGTIQATQASQDVSLAEINADVDEANDALGVAGGGKTDIIDAVQTSGALAVVVGLADFAVFGGGTTALDLVQWLLSLWNAPPLAVLHASTSFLLGLTNSITIATGAYGYVINLTVPSYWGQRSSTPVLYQPPVGYAAWRGPFGTVGDPITLLTPQIQLYPVPAGATVLDVQLSTGVTGNYQELRFL